MADPTGQVFWTVFTGTLVYVLGNLIVKLIISPIKALRTAIIGIKSDLIYYSHYATSPEAVSEEKRMEASHAFREDASELESSSYNIPFYSLWAALKIIPDSTTIDEVQDALIGLSNGVPMCCLDYNSDKIDEIEENLGFEQNKDSKVNYAVINKFSLFLERLIDSSATTAKLILLGAAGAITYDLLNTPNYIVKIMVLWGLTVPLIFALEVIRDVFSGYYSHDESGNKGSAVNKGVSEYPKESQDRLSSYLG